MISTSQSPRSPGLLQAFINGVSIGVFEKDVDGYYYWWPNERAGSWDDHSLRSVADHLTQLNAPWNAEVERELSKPPACANEPYRETEG